MAESAAPKLGNLSRRSAKSTLAFVADEPGHREHEEQAAETKNRDEDKGEQCGRACRRGGVSGMCRTFSDCVANGAGQKSEAVPMGSRACVRMRTGQCVSRYSGLVA